MAGNSTDDRISQLQAELDHLKQHLDERDMHISNYESEFIKCNEKNVELEGQMSTWREKYERLYEAHKRVQRVNQNLEDKVLDMVEKCKGEKAQLTKDIATLSVRLAESKHSIAQLQSENERYKNDMTLAIQLLQCKPDNFISQKFDALPLEMQNRVSTHVTTKTKLSPSSGKSNNNGTNSRSGSIDEKADPNEFEFSISASLMSKILEDSIHDTLTKHCESCSCSKDVSNSFSYGETHYTVATQTSVCSDSKNSLCLNCNGDTKSFNSNLSIRSDSPLAVKIFNNGNDSLTLSDKEKSSPVFLVRMSNDTKNNLSSESLNKVSDTNESNNENQKLLLSPEKKIKLVAEKHNEIMNRIGNDLHDLKTKFSVDPLTGHHRLCDRTKSNQSNYSEIKPESESSAFIVQASDFITGSKSSLENLESPSSTFAKTKSDLNLVENSDSRKMSSSSNDAASKASSTSTHKSNTHVGPGPRFCSLRVQVGSKNILLDNAQPDVPPVLYTRQPKHNDGNVSNAESLFKINNKSSYDASIISIAPENNIEAKNSPELSMFDSKEELLLKDLTMNEKHVLDCSVPNDLNVVSLLPISQNSHTGITETKKQPTSNDVIILINEDNIKVSHTDVNKNNPTELMIESTSDVHGSNTLVDAPSATNQLFNFDDYEKQSADKMHNKKVDIAQLNHHMQNTKIAKGTQILNQFELSTDLLDRNYNVQLASKHLNEINKSIRHKVQMNKNGKMEKKLPKDKRTETIEKSTSSISSEDSATVLQKQQLIRVAEWVQKNIEMSQKQENSHREENDDSFVFNGDLRQIKKIKNPDCFEKLDSVPLKMPHPVTKYSDSYLGIRDIPAVQKQELREPLIKSTIIQMSMNDVVIEPIANSNAGAICEKNKTESSDFINTKEKSNLRKSKSVGHAEDPTTDPVSAGKKELSQEELARMEYNVKQFLLKGSKWSTDINPGLSRVRRTSSHTETDL